MIKSHLEKYEEICPECNGDPKFIIKHDTYDTFYTCKYCKGTGKIDWIDKLRTGVKSNEHKKLREVMSQVWWNRKK